MSINYTLQHITETLDTFPIKWLLSSYSEEELILLEDACAPYHKPYLSYPYTIEVTPIKIYLDRIMLKGAIGILKRPLEDMPLLINDYTDERMAVVKWRLMIGR
jgi:hypothetical protein